MTNDSPGYPKRSHEELREFIRGPEERGELFRVRQASGKDAEPPGRLGHMGVGVHEGIAVRHGAPPIPNALVRETRSAIGSQRGSSYRP